MSVTPYYLTGDRRLIDLIVVVPREAGVNSIRQQQVVRMLKCVMSSQIHLGQMLVKARSSTIAA